MQMKNSRDYYNANKKVDISLIGIIFSVAVVLIGILVTITGESDLSENLAPIIVFGIAAIVLFIHRGKKKNKDTIKTSNGDRISLTQEEKYQIRVTRIKIVFLVIGVVFFALMLVLKNWKTLGLPVSVRIVQGFEKDVYEMDENEIKVFSIKVKPVDVTEEKLTVYSSNSDIVKIVRVSYENKRDYTIVNIKINAESVGIARIVISNKDEKDIAQTTVEVNEPPVITHFGKFEKNNVIFEVDEHFTAKITLKPADLDLNKIMIKTSQDGIANLANICINSDNLESVLTFDIVPIKTGKLQIAVTGSDDRGSSEKLTITIVGVGMTRTVYVTNTGSKYHYSKSCAGSKSGETTLYQASTYLEPCSKCAR